MANHVCFLLAPVFLLALPVWSATAVENRIFIEPISQPFLPHKGATTTGDQLDQSRFDDATVCGVCHSEIYQEWRSSIMSHAWDDPLYRALLKQASIATDGKVDHFCAGCHTPLGLLSGQINSDVNRESPFSEENKKLPGVDCETCHNMTDVSGLENGAYVMDVKSENFPIKRGPRRDAVSPYHATEYSDLHTRSEFCGACHNVTHPTNNVPIERTYDEWYESAYRLRGVECQDCHMKAVSGKSAQMGPNRKDRVSHHFASANTTIMQYFNEFENAERARDLLATAAKVSIAGISNDAKSGDYIDLSIKVENTGAGHKLPTGFPEGREVWLEVLITDAKGDKIFHSGEIKGGKTEPETENFKVHLGDKNGKEVDIEVWNVDRILSDNRILPLGYAEVDYQVYIPNWVATPLHVDVRLNYWPFSQAMADYLLGKDKIQVVVEELAKASSTIYLNGMSRKTSGKLNLTSR